MYQLEGRGTASAELGGLAERWGSAEESGFSELPSFRDALEPVRLRAGVYCSRPVPISSTLSWTGRERDRVRSDTHSFV